MDTNQTVVAVPEALRQKVESGQATAEEFVEYVRLTSGYDEAMALRMYGTSYLAKFDPEYGKTYVV
jgi:hypothetical protein